MHLRELLISFLLLIRIVPERTIDMPVRKTKGGGYRYGSSGKTYYGKDAKKKAAKQGRAIQASKHRYRQKH